MTAQALEQSVLESKDKDQLLAIAKALGLKASARNKKAEIIDQILTTTGSESGADGAPTTGAVQLVGPIPGGGVDDGSCRRVRNGVAVGVGVGQPVQRPDERRVRRRELPGARRGPARRLGARGRRHRCRHARISLT